MAISPRSLFIASALTLAALPVTAQARGIDSTIEYGSLKAEFAAEDRGASYGYKLRGTRSDGIVKRRAFTPQRKNFSSRKRRK